MVAAEHREERGERDGRQALGVTTGTPSTIVIDRKGVAVDADTTRTHIAAWVFSSGAWWIMLSMALAIMLAPIRLVWFLRKETRTAVRQSRSCRAASSW